LPVLSKAQVGVLAQWCFALAETGTCGSTTLAVFLALALGCGCARVRQRLREWYFAATDKPGRSRREVDVRLCFAPLARWVLAHWSGQRVALALAASSLGDRLTILAVSVVYKGSAVPSAWKILRANRKHAWRPEWLALLDLVAPALPAGWLVRAIKDHHGHPCMRVNTGGTFHACGQARRRRLADFTPRVGSGFAGAGVACTGSDRRLACTLLACWEAGYADPWYILTDLAPGACTIGWYALRAWIEQNFRLNKRGCWQWQHTRMTDPARAARIGLPMALCTCKLRAVGDAVAQDLARPLWGAALPTSPCRPTRLVCLGWLARRAAQATGRPVPRRQPLSPDTWPDWPLPAAMLDPSAACVA
jgi:hypothetical protein